MIVISQSAETVTRRSFARYFLEGKVFRKENCVLLLQSPQPALGRDRVGNSILKETAPCAKSYRLSSALTHLPQVPGWLLTSRPVRECGPVLGEPCCCCPSHLILSAQQEQRLVLQGFHKFCLRYLCPLYFQLVCDQFINVSIKQQGFFSDRG